MAKEKRSPLGVTPEQAAAQTGPKQDRGYASPKRGTSVPREGGGGRGGGEPATAVNRVGQMIDRNGPAFRVKSQMPGPQSPEAGMTQANGRIIAGPAKYGSQQEGFYDQSAQKW